MLRRCIWELSSGRSVGRNCRMIPAQMPFFLASRKDLSNSPQRKLSQTPAPAEKTSGSGNISPKVVIGSLLVGGAVLAAYQTGYIVLNTNDKKSSIPSKILDADIISKDLKHSDEQTVVSNNEEPSTSKPNMEIVEENELHHHKGFDPETKPAEEETVPVGEKELSGTLEETTPFPWKQTSDHKVSESSLNMENVVGPKADMEENTTSKNSTKQSDGSDSSFHISEETGIREAATDHAIPMETAEDSPDNEIMPQKSLADTYEGISGTSDERERTDVLTSFLKDKETSIATSGNLEDENKPRDDKILLGFLEAIHAAEKRQAELDARIFAEEKRMLKEKYEKELKDARARELMYAEEAAILDKELNKEKVKAAATMKMLQEKAEQKLQEELQRKAEEAEMELKKVQELAKAELAAAIASEKAAQIEKIAEANLHINALCMAFYARSEEARQSHSIHKLALGTLALEDALSKGLPIRAEVDALHKSLEGIDKDSLLDLTLSSLPEEALNHGADTLMQLDQKFDSLKGTLRHFSLIPAGGGGLLAHTVAHIASSIKMKEDQHGDGIESVISKVESFLVQGKLAEAADALEGGVHGSEAQEVVTEWVRRAQNRAMVEQALSLLQSYATSITFS